VSVPSSPQREMPSVLVVDDADDIRILIREVVTRVGFDVTEASSGAEAIIALAGGALHDVVVLDVQMPDMDGWDTLAVIRSRPGTARIPVILCTVKASAADARRAWALGCDGYLTKPFSIAVLAEEVATVATRTEEERVAVRAARLAAARDEDTQLR
jgi:two-component system response regulator ResD